MVHFDTHYPPTSQASLLPSPLLTRRHLSLLSCVLIFHEFHPLWDDHSETVWWKIIHYNIVIMQFPSFSCYLFSLSHLHTNITLNSFFLNILKLQTFPECERQISVPYKNRHSWSFVVLQFYTKKMGRKNILNCQKQVLYLKEMK